MNALEAGDAGRLRVGTFQSVGTRILPEAPRRFSAARPGVEIVLRESTDGDGSRIVERAPADLLDASVPSGPYEEEEAAARPLRPRRPAVSRSPR